MNFDKLVYLDREFIARKYEELKGISPDVTLSSQISGNAGVKLPIFSVGGALSETRTHKVTTRQMLEAIEGALKDNYKQFEDFDHRYASEIVWIKGDLTIGTWEDPKDARNKHDYFEILMSGERDRTATLLHTDGYLEAGYKQLLAGSLALRMRVDIPIVCLGRVLFKAGPANTLVISPFYVFEDEEFTQDFARQERRRLRQEEAEQQRLTNAM